MLLIATPSFAGSGQQHVVSPGMLAATVDEHASGQDADRAAVREALGRPEVRAVAERIGMDLDHLGAKIETISGGDLERAASAARQVNQQLVGGASTVVISTTTIIIALLIVILLIVALR
jgi:hypothetical protein